MYIYFIRQEGTGFLKIGRARNPKQRFGMIQVGSPQRLIFVGAVRQHGDFNETHIHYAFRARHYRGEWFEEKGRVANFIKNHLVWFVEQSQLFHDGRPPDLAKWVENCRRAFTPRDGSDPKKACTKCGETKPLSRFYYNEKQRYYLGYCIACQKDAAKAQRQKAKEKNALGQSQGHSGHPALATTPPSPGGSAPLSQGGSVDGY